jgi:hypothetical protein
VTVTSRTVTATLISGHRFVGRNQGGKLVSTSPGYTFTLAGNFELVAEFAQTNTHDFNGDGKSDIGWRDTSGDVAFWLMNGAAMSSSGGIGGVPGTWSIVGQRDFNGDGMADLLWHDTSGNTAMWFMNGTAVGSSASVGDIPTNWKAPPCRLES